MRVTRLVVVAVEYTIPRHMTVKSPHRNMRAITRFGDLHKKERRSFAISILTQASG
jgi:hypothetical protein